MDIKKYIASIENYPSEGIVFRDISPLLADGHAFKAAIQEIVAFCKNKEVEMIVGPEARGFIVGCPVAYEMGIGFAPARKKGKLPRETIEKSYGLEYGDDVLQLHKDAITPGQRILVCDDLLATGGTIKATIDLIEELGGEVVGTAFFIELLSLNGREKIEGYDILSLAQYE
ncbi:adenine phosphoribosyltransferase [Dolosigranulum savutiense]|uniref:Adenine phosphoribosyltransferase n=1 Tax=Dolosigranulum savutiense TaxID=3110288 RepID=A0AB74TRZ1_9LACT